MEPDDILNDALAALHRSLAQYATECWPWAESDASGDDEGLIHRIAQEQAAAVARMAELLDARQVAIDFGTYPDWSALHYVSADFLVGKIEANQREIVARLERAAAALSNDVQAKALVDGALDDARRHLGMLTARRQRPLAATA